MEENQIIVDVGLDAFIASLRHLQKQYELNTAALKAMKDAGEEQSDAYIALTQEQKVLRQQMASTEKSIQNEIKMQQAQEGSLVQLRAQLANLQKQYDSMSGMERMGEAGEELQKKIKSLHDEVLGLEGDTGRMQRNVGNYPEAMKPVTAQLREMTQQLVQLRMEGKANTAEYNELLKKTGQMKDAMEDAQREVKQMASDTSALNSVLAGAQAAAGAFSVALGVMNLVGDKDSETAKELAEAQRKLQSAIAITTGLQALQNALQKESALMMGVNKLRMLAAAAAQRAYAAATRDAEAAQVVFNKVAKSNIYVWLASVILTVVGAIAAFTRGSKEQEEQLTATNAQLEAHIDVLQRINDGYQKLRDASIKYIEDHIDRLKDEGASVEEIRKAEDELFKQQFANMDEERKMYEKEFVLYKLRKDEYAKNLRKMQQLEQARLDAYRQGDEQRARFYQNEINDLQALMDVQRKSLDVVNNWNERYNQIWSDRRKQLSERKREEEAERQRQIEAARAANERWKAEVKAIREANKTLVGHLDTITTTTMSEQEYAKAVEDTAEAMQKLADKLDAANNKLKEANELMQALGDLDDVMERLERESNPLYDFAMTYKENAQAIQETSSALESSFSSLSQMYQQMANDESKTEEERAKAARKAKAWAGIQVASNAGAAMAKGVAAAMDAPTLVGKFAALATMTSTILAAIAQAKSLLAEAHEHGGVIGGKFVGATSGSDNVLMTGRRGELVLNAEQQKRLYDIANGSASSNLTASLVEALQAMPAPVLVYSELKRFENNVNILDELSNLN